MRRGNTEFVLPELTCGMDRCCSAERAVLENALLATTSSIVGAPMSTASRRRGTERCHETRRSRNERRRGGFYRVYPTDWLTIANDTVEDAGYYLFR